VTVPAPQPRKIVRWGYTVFTRDRVSTKRMLVWSMSWTRTAARRAAQRAYALGALEVWVVVGRWTEESGWNFGSAHIRPPGASSMSRDRRAHLRLV
jgi:hypothetical protein